jgi:hypothetical protein
MVGCGYDGSSEFEPEQPPTLDQVHDVHARSDQVAPRLRKMEGVAGSNHGGDAQESVRCSRYNVGRGHLKPYGGAGAVGAKGNRAACNAQRLCDMPVKT